MYLYINGILQDSLSILGLGDMSNSVSIEFGRHKWFDTGSLGEYLNGDLDEISFWNKALNQSEIQDYMNCPPTGNEADLIGYWNMDEGNGTILTDLSGNGNDGTINGATWSNDTPTQICDNCTTEAFMWKY